MGCWMDAETLLGLARGEFWSGVVLGCSVRVHRLPPALYGPADIIRAGPSGLVDAETLLGLARVEL